MTPAAPILALIDELERDREPDEFEDAAREIILDLQGRLHRPRERDGMALAKEERIAAYLRDQCQH